MGLCLSGHADSLTRRFASKAVVACSAARVVSVSIVSVSSFVSPRRGAKCILLRWCAASDPLLSSSSSLIDGKEAWPEEKGIGNLFVTFAEGFVQGGEVSSGGK